MEKEVEAAVHMAGRCQGGFQYILVLCPAGCQLDYETIKKIRAFYSENPFI